LWVDHLKKTLRSVWIKRSVPVNMRPRSLHVLVDHLIRVDDDFEWLDRTPLSDGHEVASGWPRN